MYKAESGKNFIELDIQLRAITEKHKISIHEYIDYQVRRAKLK